VVLLEELFLELRDTLPMAAGDEFHEQKSPDEAGLVEALMEGGQS